MAAPVAALVLLEGGLRLAGYGHPGGFLIPDATPGYWRTNPDFASTFLPGNFDLRPLNFRVAERKPPGTVRIVVLGESAAQGVPVPSFGFAAQLRAQLRARFPGRAFEVLNTGIVAIDSHVVLRIARDMEKVHPDLYLVYAGNNEVVGPYGPGCAYLPAMPPLWIIRASAWIRSTRTGQLIAATLARLQTGNGPAPQWGGMSMFVHHAVRGDDPRLVRVYRNFAANLRGIVAAASQAGAKTLLCTVVANLKDCPPFLSLHEPALSAPALERWKAAFNAGRLSWEIGDAAAALPRLETAAALDPEYADTHFMLGRIALRAGRTADARRELFAALQWDALRFRPDAGINRAVREVARTSGPSVRLVDSAVALGADPSSTGTPAGRGLLFEHVHFDWDGNYAMGLLLAKASASALFGDGPARGRWLDSAGCARALAYTEHERFPMLLRMEALIRKPPFDGQLTYCEDQARMARELAAAARSGRTAAALQTAEEVTAAALAGDPDNPALDGVMEGIDLDRGDVAGALAMARKAGKLLPASPALAADQGNLLLRLGRAKEAEAVLLAAARSSPDAADLAPVLVRLWSKTRRFDAGRRFLAAALARDPAEWRLHLALAELLRAVGAAPAAEREYRAALSADPEDRNALEGLIGTLLASGRRDAADAEVLAAVAVQPGDQDNDLRAAKLYATRGDSDAEIRCLDAAERGGPVDATFELTVALKLFRLHRMPEVMDHLAQAVRLSRGEGNPSVTESILALLRRLGGPD